MAPKLSCVEGEESDRRLGLHSTGNTDPDIKFAYPEFHVKEKRREGGELKLLKGMAV